MTEKEISGQMEVLMREHTRLTNIFLYGRLTKEEDRRLLEIETEVDRLAEWLEQLHYATK